MMWGARPADVPAVRTSSVDGGKFWVSGMNSVLIGAWSIPSARESATTPTISAGFVHDVAPVMPLVSFQLIWRPVGPTVLKEYLAIRSLTMPTGGEVLVSLAWNERPALSGMPIVSK